MTMWIWKLNCQNVAYGPYKTEKAARCAASAWRHLLRDATNMAGFYDVLPVEDLTQILKEKGYK